MKSTPEYIIMEIKKMLKSPLCNDESKCSEKEKDSEKM